MSLKSWKSARWTLMMVLLMNGQSYKMKDSGVRKRVESQAQAGGLIEAHCRRREMEDGKIFDEFL